MRKHIAITTATNVTVDADQLHLLTSYNHSVMNGNITGGGMLGILKLAALSANQTRSLKIYRLHYLGSTPRLVRVTKEELTREVSYLYRPGLLSNEEAKVLVEKFKLKLSLNP
jgi:hypothetical protein